MAPRGNSFDYTTNRHEITVYYVVSYCSIDQAIFSTIDWHFTCTMACFPASPLKTPRRLSTCATTMRERLVYERRRYVTVVKMRHGLATLNSNNPVVCGQKHEVRVLDFFS